MVEALAVPETGGTSAVVVLCSAGAGGGKLGGAVVAALPSELVLINVDDAVCSAGGVLEPVVSSEEVVEVPKTVPSGGVLEASGITAPDETVVGEAWETASAGSGAAWAVTTSWTGWLGPPSTVNCSAGEAKLCQSKMMLVVAGAGISILKPVSDLAVTAELTNWSSAVTVTIGW